MPWMPIRYSGHFQGWTVVCEADGSVLARRHWREGEGVAVADVAPERSAPTAEPPARFWLHRRGWLPALVWNYQRAHGRRWYRRHVAAGAAADGAARDGTGALPRRPLSRSGR
jgi:hypothetical protein